MNIMLMHICAGGLADESKAAADEAFIASLNDRIVAASRDEADRPSSVGSSTPSFDDAGDDELASALSARIADLGEGLEVGSAPAALPVAALSGAPRAPALCMRFLAPAVAGLSEKVYIDRCPQAVLVLIALARMRRHRAAGEHTAEVRAHVRPVHRAAPARRAHHRGDERHGAPRFCEAAVAGTRTALL